MNDNPILACIELAELQGLVAPDEARAQYESLTRALAQSELVRQQLGQIYTASEHRNLAFARALGWIADNWTPHDTQFDTYHFAEQAGQCAVEAIAGHKQRPTIVCLCGSTRFWKQFQKAGLDETLAGRIVLSIGAASGTDDEHFGNLPRQQYDAVKADLDALHLAKIALADEVLILNVGGYIGESTRRELAHAYRLGKRIRWLEPDKANGLAEIVLAEMNQGV